MTTYRNTGLTVRSPRIMIDNPDKTESPQAQAGIQFERIVVVDQPGFGRTSKQVQSCSMKYIPEPEKEGYNGSNTFTLFADTIPNVTELTYDQFYMIAAALFEHASTIQDTADIARENLQAAMIAQGINAPFIG